MANKFLSEKFLHEERNSVWAISCANHCYGQQTRFYNSALQKVNNDTVKAAVESFVFDQKRIVDLDDLPWPHNVGCSS